MCEAVFIFTATSCNYKEFSVVYGTELVSNGNEDYLSFRIPKAEFVVIGMFITPLNDSPFFMSDT